MMSYLWIFVLGSLVVTGVKMQDDGVDDTEKADDLAPGESTVPDEAADAEEPAPEETPEEPAPEETPEEPAPEEPAPEEPAPEEPAPEEPAPEEPALEEAADPEAEDTNTDTAAEEDGVPAAAEEEAAGEETEEEAPAETDEAEETKAEADESAGDPEVPEEEITAEEAPGDAEEELAQDQTEGGEENTENEADADETVKNSVLELSPVPEEPVDSDKAVKVHSVGFDLSDALNEDLGNREQPEDPVKSAVGGADRHSAGQGKARSAGAVSEPNDSGSGTVVGVVCGIAVAAVGAITGYFTYQKKKLCFKVQQGDPESAKEENGTQSDPQVLSTLLNSS
ncbi:cytochrome c1 isoform X2 [Puntigrus tetrazona]|uniref:cytochrome c1 isoform X2 n=1 Tax=Puntigrus tetrazona TaxID=1606681 RepID=UPI001C891A3A|nr:cytochrome c1 isoform X2 [Puntigrus tetrazona]